MDIWLPSFLQIEATTDHTDRSRDRIAWILPLDPACDADVDQDGRVDFHDLLAVLAAWGPCPSTPCPEDIDGDNVVTLDDVVLVLAAWSP